MAGRLLDGFPTFIVFELDPTASLWEKSVTPPGIQGGGANETATMRNLRWRTKSPKKLATLGDSSVTACYNPDVYETMLTLVQVNGEIGILFPDGSAVVFWGWMDDFSPNEITEGEQPDADVTIIPSNQDDAGDEVEPDYYAPGTLPTWLEDVAAGHPFGS